MIDSNNSLIIHKPIGLTSLEALNKFKQENLEYQNIKMTYAGRLDPMAEGQLLLIYGEALKNQAQYQNLTKEYEVEILFGFQSDSYDLLGLPKKAKQALPETGAIRQLVENLPSEINLPLPPYSSYRVKGKPLFYWAFYNKLKEISIPVRQSRIYATELLEQRFIQSSELLKQIENKFSFLNKDFRQDKIYPEWQKLLNQAEQFPVIKLRLKVASGTYIRSIAHFLGQELKSGALLLSLKRTKIG